MANYWTSKHQIAITEYYYSTSTESKNRIIDKVLHKPLYEIARRALSALRMKVTPERESDIVIHLVYKTMPRLSEQKLKGAQQYLYTAARNYTLTYFCNEGRSFVDVDTLTSTSCPVSYVTNNTAMAMEDNYERDLVRKRIMDEIDLRLKGQHILNTTNSVFLLLMKQYILDNDYDIRGFGEYVTKNMHLKLNTYRAIAGRLNVRTLPLNEPLFGKEQNNYKKPPKPIQHI